MNTAADQWREQLASWAIPEEILATAEDSPWVLPVEVFARRADDAITTPHGVSWQRASQALRPQGTVLDVGAGAGAASLPLAPHTSQLIAVDTNPAMLEALAHRAGRIGLPTRTIVGCWPDVADQTPIADVVTCHHVCYNVADLGPFAQALTTHARRRVVVELTATHPLSALNSLWQVMHGLTRPNGPTAADAVAVLREAGIQPHQQTWHRLPPPEHTSFDDLVTVTQRRLCLPSTRRPELVRALLDLGVDPNRPHDLRATDDTVITLWWDGKTTGSARPEA